MAKQAAPPAQHPVDVTREALIASVPKRRRQALESTIRLARTAREEASQAEHLRIVREHAARKMLQSSATMQRVWDVAVAQADEAAVKIIEACYHAGAKDPAIAAFASADLEHSLSAFMMSRFGHSGPLGAQAAVRYASQAQILASRIPDRVHSERAAFERTAGSTFERLKKRLADRPTVAWILLVSVVATAALGIVLVAAQLWKLFTR